MAPEPQTAEFLSLLKDAREQLAYFKELGVENLEPACVGQAMAPEPPEEPWAASAQTRAIRSSAATSSARGSSLQEDTGPVALDTLFGDLAPAPVRIQKSFETFEDIWADIGECTRCPLYQERTNIVHTDGNRKARLMFVGEAPGADEDAQARPFVGRAGQLLTKIIEAIGLKREEVLIGNVNRCRPPGNRPPTPEEASMCKPFLLREIAVVQPEVIVVLGNTAMRNLLDIKQGITRVRGQFQDYHGVKVMPTFHPAYLLRDPSKKKETWEDLKKVRDYLDSNPKRES
jgi:DNA polymerase